jgi:N-acetylmuramoyl-L-alanine amidase
MPMTVELIPGFEADVDPETRSPRLRLNFANGWTASVVLSVHADRITGATARLACWPTAGQEHRTELGEQEAFPDEVASYLAQVAARPDVNQAV